MDDPYARRRLVAGILLLIFFLISLIGEAMTDRIVRFWLGVILCSLVLLVSALGFAFAKNLDGRYDNSPNHQWYESQHNSIGGWCCNEADGHEYDGNYTFDADGNVHLSLEGNEVTIEAFKVLHGPNPTGHAVVWYLLGYNGMPNTFCFIPGSLT
jgi:hypothetical protein